MEKSLNNKWPRPKKQALQFFNMLSPNMMANDTVAMRMRLYYRVNYVLVPSCMTHSILIPCNLKRDTLVHWGMYC